MASIREIHVLRFIVGQTEKFAQQVRKPKSRRRKRPRVVVSRIPSPETKTHIKECHQKCQCWGRVISHIGTGGGAGYRGGCPDAESPRIPMFRRVCVVDCGPKAILFNAASSSRELRGFIV